MEDLSKIMKHVCPNICKECRPQCKKWQDISNLGGHELMNFIETQQAIVGAGNVNAESPPRKTNFSDAVLISSGERQEAAKMTSCCLICDTILQQISILLSEIWDIIEPEKNICNICRLSKHGKCSCQQTGTYSSRFDVPSTKEGFLSWLTKLRHILLKVLEGVTRGRCQIYKGEPKDELEKLLQELRVPLQKQARDIRITSLTKFPLSSTDHDESVVASLIENTELLERVLAKIKAEGRKIEMKILEDHKYLEQNKINRLPELKLISVQPFPSSTSSFASDHKMFPPIPGKSKSDEDELKTATSRNDKSQKIKSDDLRMDKAKSPYERRETTIKGRLDNTNARKKHHHIPLGDLKYEGGGRKSRSAVIQDKHQIYSSEKSKTSSSPTERKALKSVSFPGMLKDRKTRGIREPVESKKSGKSTDPFIGKLQEARARASSHHLDTNYREKRRGHLESSFEDKLQSKGKTKDENDKKTPLRKLPVLDKKTLLRERFDKLESLRGDKIKEKTKDEKHKKSRQIKEQIEDGISTKKESDRENTSKTKSRFKGQEDTEAPKSKSKVEGKSSTGDQRDKDLDSQLKKLTDSEEKSVRGLDSEKIKKRSKSKSKFEQTSIDKREASTEEIEISKRKLKKATSKAKTVSLPSDKETYKRRYTVQISPQAILKKMHEEKVAQLRMQKRLARNKDKPFKKIKSIKSLPNLELLREKQRLKKRKQTFKEISESDITECASVPEPFEMIRGNRVVPLEFLPKPDYDVDPEPLLFKVQAHLSEDPSLHFKALSKSAISLGSQKSCMGKGIIEYKLSDPKYIDLGYTKLPTVRVMGKSIVYKMEQSQPEDDWFRRRKRGSTLFYDTCERLAEVDDDGHGRWYYKNGRMALNYTATEGHDTRNRYIVYSSGEGDNTGNPQCDTILASFDHLGNGIVYDHCGNVRLKYNQNEGENFDKSICPLGKWKWHSLSTTLTALQNVYVEQHVKLVLKSNLNMFEDSDDDSKESEQFEETPEEIAEEQKNMFKIEMSNFFKEKKEMLLRKYRPFQLKMMVLKLNEQFSMRIYEQGKIYLYFNTGTRSLKLNLGLILVPNEVLGTEMVNLREIMTPFDRHIPQSESVANILDIVNENRKKMRKKHCFYHKFYSGIRNTSSFLGVMR